MHLSGGSNVWGVVGSYIVHENLLRICASTGKLNRNGAEKCLLFVKTTGKADRESEGVKKNGNFLKRQLHFLTSGLLDGGLLEP